MSGDPAAAETGAAAPSAPEVVRVLVPSRIGPLGVEFRHTAIIRLVVAPKGADRRRFFPFSDFEDS